MKFEELSCEAQRIVLARLALEALSSMSSNKVLAKLRSLRAMRSHAMTEELLKSIVPPNDKVLDEVEMYYCFLPRFTMYIYTKLYAKYSDEFLLNFVKDKGYFKDEEFPVTRHEIILRLVRMRGNK